MELDLAQLPPYQAVDFKALSLKDKDLNEIWQISNGHLDFQNPETCQTLTKTILRVDFGLELSLPDDRLCPPIPNRWNYVSWIQGLLDSTSPHYSGKYEPDREVMGLDIGTGASAIYALLALKSRPKWQMCVTDVDKESFESAACNFAINNLMTRTKMLLQLKDASLIPIKYLAEEKLDFVMCNPPFFADEAEMQSSVKGEGKSQKPNAVCTGSENEMVYPGGDLAFVRRMIGESLVLREKVTWYSSMLGKLSSAKSVIETLRQHGVANWAVGCLEPGNATKRWVVAWSFGDLRPRNDIARHQSVGRDHLPFPTRYTIHLSNKTKTSNVEETLNAQLSPLDLKWTWDSKTKVGIGAATQNVWKRAYRRERERMQKYGGVYMGQGEEPGSISLAFRIVLFQGSVNEIAIDWLRGVDRQLWESFCGMIHQHFRKT